jgi:hypothetical protein
MDGNQHKNDPNVATVLFRIHPSLFKKIHYQYVCLADISHNANVFYLNYSVSM